MTAPPFVPLTPGPLRDEELELSLETVYHGDTTRDWVPYYDFTMWAPRARLFGSTRVSADGKRKLAPAGNVSLRVGNAWDILLYLGHIGYGVNPSFRGHHYAERATRLVLPLARAHGLDTLWITCNPDNQPSRRTCELLGAEMVEVVPVPSDYFLHHIGERWKCRYRLDISGVEAASGG